MILKKCEFVKEYTTISFTCNSNKNINRLKVHSNISGD